MKMCALFLGTLILLCIPLHLFEVVGHTTHVDHSMHGSHSGESAAQVIEHLVQMNQALPLELILILFTLFLLGVVILCNLNNTATTRQNVTFQNGRFVTQTQHLLHKWLRAHLTSPPIQTGVLFV